LSIFEQMVCVYQKQIHAQIAANKHPHIYNSEMYKHSFTVGRHWTLRVEATDLY